MKKMETSISHNRERPAVLYKYLNWGDWVVKFFEGESLKFTSRIDFNDPFDSNPGVHMDLLSKEGRDHFKEFLSGMSPAKKISRLQMARNLNRSPKIPTDPYLKETLDDIGILSLSENWDGLLMWAHYASMHRGFCVGFHTSEDVFATAKPVTYQTEFPIIQRPQDSPEKLLEKAFFTKSICWEYEDEWRIVKQRANKAEIEHYHYATQGTPKNSVTIALIQQNGHGFYKFDNRSIESITLGMRISANQKGILLGISKKLGVPIYEITPPKTSFSLTRVLVRKN